MVWGYMLPSNPDACRAVLNRVCRVSARETWGVRCLMKGMADDVGVGGYAVSDDCYAMHC